MWVRRLHAWLAMLAAPTILFFTLAGALQLFGLHELHGTYHPPLVIEELGRLHKDQVFAPEHRRRAAAASTALASVAEATGPADPLPVVLLRWVFLAASLVLCLSTGLGLWIGLRQLRRTRAFRRGAPRAKRAVRHRVDRRGSRASSCSASALTGPRAALPDPAWDVIDDGALIASRLA